MALDNETTERIRRRAYEIWQEKGSPDGSAEDHWHQARQEVEANDARGSATSEERAPPNPAKKRAPRRKAKS